MTKKTESILVMVSPEIKKKLKDKASSSGLSITAFLEHIAVNEIVILDDNFKKAAKLFTSNNYQISNSAESK